MTTKQKRKVVNINEIIYEKLKSYCQKRGLKISWFVENIIEKSIKE